LKHYWIQRNDDLLQRLQSAGMSSWVVS